MTDQDKKQLGKTLWNIADQLRGAMNPDDFRDYMLSFLFLRYLSDNYEASAKRELGKDYPDDEELHETQQGLGVTIAGIIFVIDDLLHGSARADAEGFQLDLHYGHAIDEQDHEVMKWRERRGSKPPPFAILLSKMNE